MKLLPVALLVLVTVSVLSACNDPCANVAPPLGESCGSTFCTPAGYCASDAGPPTCASKKGPGAGCLEDKECAGGTCELDGGCGPVPPGDSSGSCG